MLAVYHTLIGLTKNEFNDIVTQTRFIGGTVASPNKLRLLIIDGSFLDIWLSADGDYSYHWEQRGQTGKIYRWDNAPHHHQVSSFPDHFHEGNDRTVVKSNLSHIPKLALYEVLEFVKQKLHFFLEDTHE